MRGLALMLLFFLACRAQAGDFDRDFAVVFATGQTETRYGKLPLDRKLLAMAIEQASKAQAKGVVLKFFLDLPRDGESDGRLARSLSLLPVVLQARLDDQEPNPNPLPERFRFPGQGLQTAVKGASGWIPLPAFAGNSHDVCFVDFAASPVPVLETYQGHAVRSLLLCAAELARGARATLRPGTDLQLGPVNLPLTANYQTPVTMVPAASLQTIEFSDLVEGKVPEAALKGRVVLLAYDGPNIHVVPSPVGPLGAHRAFVLLLKSFYEGAP